MAGLAAMAGLCVLAWLAQRWMRVMPEALSPVQAPASSPFENGDDCVVDAARDPMTQRDLALAVEAVEALLPQVQCERCGFPGCRPYAQAIVEGAARINRCPPGGEALVAQLAELLGEPLLPLDLSRGEPEARSIARIDATRCIGCTKCLAPCPTDAIIGTQGMLHAVIEARCTGCGLCLPPCPVDCIDLVAQVVKE